MSVVLKFLCRQLQSHSFWFVVRKVALCYLLRWVHLNNSKHPLIYCWWYSAEWFYMSRFWELCLHSSPICGWLGFCVWCSLLWSVFFFVFFFNNSVSLDRDLRGRYLKTWTNNIKLSAWLLARYHQEGSEKCFVLGLTFWEIPCFAFFTRIRRGDRWHSYVCVLHMKAISLA